MDKTEYHMRLDEINRLVEAQDYEGALEIADTIEWKRVKSVRTLCMVADIYEVNGELEESMRMLQLAYKRSSVGKMILYRQVELSLKMGRYDDAVKYYNQYLETAANDTSKYILKYKIYKAQNAPLEDQIAILEEYKDREYTERWVYELARLYKKAGKQNKCIDTCDDLILWFGEGKYVIKAMELKMTYVPLTPAQKAKYDQRNIEKEENKQQMKASEPETKVTASTVAGISAAAMASLQKASIIPLKEEVTVKTDNTAEEILASPEGIDEAAAAAEMPEVSEQSEKKPFEDIPVHVDTTQLQEKLAKSFQEVLSGFNRTKVVNAFEALGRATGSETSSEPAEEENIEEYQVTDLEPEIVNESKISAERGEAIAHRTEISGTDEPEPVKEEKPEDKEVTSLQDMDLEALFAETSGMFAEAAESRQEELGNAEVASEEQTEEVPVIVEEQDEEVSENVIEEKTADEKENIKLEEVQIEEPAETKIELDQDAEAAMAAFEASLLNGLDGFAGATEEVIQPEEVSEPEAEVVIPEETSEPQEEVTIPDEALEPEEEVTIPEEAPEPEEEVVIPEEALEPEEKVVIPEEAFESKEEVTASEEIIEPEEELLIPEEAIAIEDNQELIEEDDDIKIAPPIGRHEESNLEEQLLAALKGQPETVVQDEKEEDENAIPDLDLELVMELQKEKEDSELPKMPVLEETEEAREEELSEIDQMLADAEKEIEMPLVIPEAETPEDMKRRILDSTRPEKLSDEQKRLFSYFSKVPGMDEQILEAIDGVYQYASEKTSRRGNIAIMGSHGTGKTRLSEGIVKAICKEFGLEAVKYANLDASDMNRKDPATVISKMAGGFLLIERASFMTEETIEKLSQAMDFRTDSMILIIEDDKANMRKLLADYPKFAKKFETVISIPVFTNDELVTFARTYAKENGYRMDEMGVLALYELIGNNQREDEPITIGKVKEMVDGAIRRASGARLGRRISKRHTDEDGRILLYEKDFDV